jgi:hypothetical protein
MVEKVHRVRASALEVGEKVERSEHPWASPKVARQIARDHLERNPNEYSGGGKDEERTVVILNQNVKAVPARKKKKVQPRQEPSGPGWIPQNLRMWG